MVKYLNCWRVWGWLGSFLEPLLWLWKSTDSIDLKFKKRGQNFLIRLLKPSQYRSPLGAAQKTQVLGSLRQNSNFSLFFIDFSLIFLVTLSHPVDFDVSFTMNIDSLHYDALLFCNRGSKSQNSCPAHLVSSHLHFKTFGILFNFNLPSFFRIFNLVNEMKVNLASYGWVPTLGNWPLEKIWTFRAMYVVRYCG